MRSLCPPTLDLMSVLERVQHDVKDAMKAGERERVHALRLIVNELQKAQKDAAGDDLAVLQRERKRRLEAAEAYRDGGPDRARRGRGARGRDHLLLHAEQVSDEELAAIVGDAVAESGPPHPRSSAR